MPNLIGQRIGQYEILALLGEGGMATVYRARQLNMQREIALKVIQPDPKTSKDVVPRFQREAHLIASFSHLHILKVFDYGQFYGHHLRLIDASVDPRTVLFYLAMELLTGGNLADRIKAAPMSVQALTKVLEQIASALDYAHQRGVVHRDLKPKNVMFDQEGNAILTDFGIAKMVDDELAITRTGMSMGTPLYMAPEQWQGKAVDPRTDLYALGIIVYEMLTGSVPFKADTPFAMANLHVNEPPPPLRRTRPDLPERVEQVVNKSLAKNPKDRYATASELVAVLKEAFSQPAPPPPTPMDGRTVMYNVDGTPVPMAQSQPILIEPPRARSRNGLLVGGIAAGLVLLALVGLLLSRGSGGGPTPTPSVLAQGGSTNSSLETGQPELAGTGTQSATLSTVGVAAAGSASPRANASPTEASTEAATATTAPTMTATTAPSATPTVPPSATPTPPPTNTPTRTATPTRTPTFTPTITRTPTATYTATNTPLPTAFGGGKSQVVFFSNRDGNGEIYVMDSDGKNTRRLTNNPAADEWPAWSPDGKQIVLTSNREGNGEIYIMDADGTDIHRLTNNPAYDWYPAWSPDGKSIAFVSDREGNNEIYIMDADGSNQRRLTNSSTYDWFPSWSPDSKQIVFASNREGNEKLYAINVNGTNLRRLTNNPTDDVSPSWSPDGKLIAFVSERDGNREIYVMGANGTNQRRLTNNSAADSAPSWSSDSKQIIFVSERDNNREIYIMSLDGSNTRRMTTSSASDFGPQWQP